MNASIRKPAFSGRFYPGNPSSLFSLINQFVDSEKDKFLTNLISDPIIGGIVPHAGMIFSGCQAVHFYELVRQSKQEFDTVVIVNPNHSGRGSGMFNTSSYQFWETPLGKIEADLPFIVALHAETNNQAHDNEHSGEVQLPFLQHVFNFPYRLAMITMNVQSVGSSILLAEKIHYAVKETGRRILLIASSDFNHYESPETGYKKDQYVIDKILEFDHEGVYREVKKYHVSACGYGPIMALLNYAKLVSEKPSIEILKRGHSGEVYPSGEVVDYVSFLVTDSKNGQIE
jgi:AmmeMemoRadiSam system protein B